MSTSKSQAQTMPSPKIKEGKKPPTEATGNLNKTLL